MDDLREISRLLAEHRDLLHARVRDGDASALSARGWSDFLLALDDSELARVENGGAWPPGTPASLAALAISAQRACEVRALPTLRASPPRVGESPRKRAQIDAFAEQLLPLAARAKRVIDVGSGHGHLTRDLAERVGVPVVGLERDAALASRARELAPSVGRGRTRRLDERATFTVRDVLREGLALERDDLVIGLHACGELGDVMVESAARAGASLALVACCPQKRRQDVRAPLCSPGVELARRVLGLANLVAREVGVEATRAENLAARERRLALHHLLSAHVSSLRHGAEIEGINRRTAHAPLSVLVERAFAVRELEAPSVETIAAARAWAAERHARTRRLSLPRTLLARVIEVYLLRDRAGYLEDRGFDVAWGVLFPASVSARNLVLLARPDFAFRVSRGNAIREGNGS